MQPESVATHSPEEGRKLWYLKRIKMFAGLPRREMRDIRRITKMESYAKGQLIYLPGDPGDTVFLLKKGRVKVSRVNEEGKEVLLTILEPGEIFGEVEAVGDVSRETLVQSLEKVLVCEIRREDFNRYLHQYPHVGGRVLKLIGARLRAVESRIGELVFKSAAARLAGVLLNLSETMGEAEGEGIRLQARLTHQNLANLIGTSRETVSALISQFVQRGLIQQAQRYIVILDKGRLAKVQ